jgi:photosystem II stability/assembly factor-like uncharacterized protein
MSPYRSLLPAVAVLLMTGAGCLGFGGSEPATSSTGGLWVSENAGTTWEARSTLLTATGASSINGLDILAFEQDPTDATVVYAGSKTNGLFYSTDGGASWLRPEDKEASSGSVLGIEVDPNDICTYYVLKPQRLLKTETCGREFNIEAYVETRTDEALTTLAIDWYKPSTLFIGTTEGDVLRSTDSGETWTAIYRARNSVTDIAVSNADSRIIYVGTRSNGVFRSTDGGTTWVDSDTALEDYKKADNVYSFAQTADGSRVLMSSAYGLLYSDDNGVTWNGVSLVTSAGEVTVRAAEISPEDKQNFYYSTGNTFYSSTSSGSSWKTTNLPTSRAAAVIRVDQDNNERVYLGVVSLEK